MTALILAVLSDCALATVDAEVTTPKFMVARSGTPETLPSADIEIVFSGNVDLKASFRSGTLAKILTPRKIIIKMLSQFQTQGFMFISIFYQLITYLLYKIFI